MIKALWGLSEKPSEQWLAKLIGFVFMKKGGREGGREGERERGKFPKKGRKGGREGGREKGRKEGRKEGSVFVPVLVGGCVCFQPFTCRSAILI